MSIGDLVLVLLAAYIGLVGAYLTCIAIHDAREKFELWRLKRTLARMPRVMRERKL